VDESLSLPLSGRKEPSRVYATAMRGPGVRCSPFFAIFILLCTLATPAGAVEPIAAQGPERLVMPYSCAIENGEPVLRPGPERPFPIVETRYHRPYTTCNPPFSNNCRSMMVHKFDVLCGGQRVPWVQLAAAFGRSKVGRVWLEKGHIVMTRKAEGDTGSVKSCSEKNAQNASTSASTECVPWRVSREVERLVLPENFAPVAEFGARFIGGATPGGPGSGPEASSITLAKADGVDNAEMRPHEQTIVRSALPDATAALVNPGPALEFEDKNWVTVVEAEDLSDRPDQASASPALTFATWFAALIALSAAGWFGWQNRALIPAKLVPAQAFAQFAQFTPFATGQHVETLRKAATGFAAKMQKRIERPETTEPVSSDPLIANAAANVSQLLQQTERTVANLTGATPLRDMLQQELASVKSRLAAAESTTPDGQAGMLKLVAQFRTMNRDLDQIQRIAASAIISLSGIRRSFSLPKTRAEALEVLNAPADVSETVLKRLVDVQRQSWHPDLCKDDADRLVREERIKQINVAWDLITGKRSTG
jgi:hypothetical protein